MWNRRARLNDVRRFVGLLVIVVLFLASCGPTETGPTTSTGPAATTTTQGELQDLHLARQLWAAESLSSYNFVFENDCGECDPVRRLPKKVVVWDGIPGVARQPTVESLFSQIEAAIEGGRNVEVKYDSDLGHPEEISIDMQTRPVDGGIHLLVSSLERGLPGEDISVGALEEARKKWDVTRPEAYQFTTAIGCDCRLAGEMWARVEGRRILEWDVIFDDGAGDEITAITIDQMFDDLHRMLISADGVVEEGIRFTGSAEYDPDLGYPLWVGLDIEILDPESELAYLPPRLVFAINHFEPIDEPGQSAAPELEAARRSWQDTGLADYVYELTIHDIVSASFSDPYVVTVEGGVVTRVEHDGREVSDGEAPILPIEGLFELIEAEMGGGDRVDVLYHYDLGYPVFVGVSEPGSGDSSLVMSISLLEPTNDG